MAGTLRTPYSSRDTGEPPSGACSCLSCRCTVTSCERPTFGPEERAEAGGRRSAWPGSPCTAERPRSLLQQRTPCSVGAGCSSEPECHLEPGASHCPVFCEVRTQYGAVWQWDEVTLETLPQPRRWARGARWMAGGCVGRGQVPRGMASFTMWDSGPGSQAPDVPSKHSRGPRGTSANPHVSGTSCLGHEAGTGKSQAEADPPPLRPSAPPQDTAVASVTRLLGSRRGSQSTWGRVLAV